MISCMRWFDVTATHARAPCTGHAFGRMHAYLKKGYSAPACCSTFDSNTHVHHGPGCRGTGKDVLPRQPSCTRRPGVQDFKSRADDRELARAIANAFARGAEHKCTLNSLL